MTNKLPLSDLTINITDGKHGDCKNEEGSGYYFLSVKDLKPYKIDFKNARQITKADFIETHKRTKLERGDILLANSGNTIGKMFYVNDIPEINKSTFQKSVAIIKPDSSKIHGNYLYYNLLANVEGLRRAAVGSAQPNLLLRDLRAFQVSIHKERNQQESIAGFLSVLDKKIQLNNQVNIELEGMAKLIYDYWFVQFDFPDVNGNPYKSSGGKMVYNEELKCEIPDGWSNGSLNDLGDIAGGSTPSTKDTSNFAVNGTPWITPKDLSKNIGNKYITRGEQGVSEQGIKSASLKVYPKDTVLMSSRAPIGYMAIAREGVTTNQGFKSFIPNKGYSSKFIYYTVKNAMKAIVQYSSDSTFKEVSGTTLKTVKVCLPKIEVSDTYSNKVGSIFERQNLLELENQRLVELSDWLLPMLMNGQVTVK
jgi:type I restriction enzyme S subunit